jgi:probable HAF family extracellular repeat protein
MSPERGSPNLKEKYAMRSIKFTPVFTASILLLAVGNPLSAQDASPVLKPKHHQYRFIDLGTFGGPDSIVPFIQRVLTQQGTIVGIAETDIPDPFAPNCSNPNCKVQSGFEWRKGLMTKLHGLSANGENAAQAINDSDTIVGDSQDGLLDPVSGLPEINAVRWKHGEIEKLGTLGGNSSGALAISNGGQVTGWSETTIVDPSSGETETHAFLWRNGVIHDLGTLGGPLSFGQAVNNEGEVVGFSYTSSIPNKTTGIPTSHPFIWRNGQMTDLSLGGSLGGSGFVNSHSQAIGDSTLPGDTEDHAFFWSRGTLRDLGTLGGTFSNPTGLTEEGHISGVATTTNDELLHAVLWRNQEITDLGTVPGDACSWAWGLNSRDQVVGISLPSPCDFSTAHAFLWERGSMVDLNTLIPSNSGLQLVYGEAINDAGEIVGIGVPPGVSPGDVEILGHVYVLIPQDGIGGDQYESAETNTSEIAKTEPTANTRVAAARMIRRIRELQLRKYRLSKR